MRGKAITSTAAMLPLLFVCSATLYAREVPYPLNQMHKGVLLGIIDSIKPTGEE